MESAMEQRPPEVPFETLKPQILSLFASQESVIAPFTDLIFEKMLPSERDVNYLLRIPGEKSERVILKVSNKSDDKLILNAQSEAMMTCFKSNCKTQYLFQPTDKIQYGLSDYLFELQIGGDSEENTYFARLFSYVEGELLSSITAEKGYSKEEIKDAWAAAGAASGKVSATLKQWFENIEKEDKDYHDFLKSVESSYDWNLANVASVLKNYLPHFDHGQNYADQAPIYANRKRCLEEKLSDFEKFMNKEPNPILAKTLVHNDPNDNNIVIEIEQFEEKIKKNGIAETVVRKKMHAHLLDWGDLSYSYALADVAIGAAYMNDGEIREAFVDAWIRGSGTGLSLIVT